MNTKSTQRFACRVPVRIDLAGGTVDLWPIYLLLPDPQTINLAINLWAEATVTIVNDAENPGVRFRSEDQGLDVEWTWSELEKRIHLQKVPPTGILHARLTDFFSNSFSAPIDPKIHLTLETKAKSPAGAGLGGSSALAIAIANALGFWRLGKTLPPEQAINIVKDVESQILKIPAGLQDYYGAQFGGLQRISWQIDRHDRVAYPDSTLKGVGERLVAFYSGKSRNSGINNWTLFKNFLDQKKSTVTLFKSITKATHSLDQALRAEDWKKVTRAIQLEWFTRKKLASGIATKEMLRAEKIAKAGGFKAFKVCGAGGGGCFFIMNDKPIDHSHDKTIAKIEALGMNRLPFEVSSSGARCEVV